MPAPVPVPPQPPPTPGPFFTSDELRAFVGLTEGFTGADWWGLAAWAAATSVWFVGSMALLLAGLAAGASFPAYVWLIPAGGALFAASLTVDNIGHRTRYRDELARGELLIHYMIVFTAVPSVVLLALGFWAPGAFDGPAVGLTALSFFYSAMDEWMHWRRFGRDGVDRVEAWLHYGAILGHVLLVSAWWQWYLGGYPGLHELVVGAG